MMVADLVDRWVVELVGVMVVLSEMMMVETKVFSLVD